MLTEMAAPRPVKTTRPKRIFVLAVMLTDHVAHGDGLHAYRLLLELAARGHELIVAYDWAELSAPPPPNVYLHRIALGAGDDIVRRLEYAWKIRGFFERHHRERPFDLIHQINPVYNGHSVGLIGTPVPLVMGPLLSMWVVRTPLATKALAAVRWLQEQKADALMVATESAKERIIDKRRAAGRTHLVPFGVDASAFPSQPLPPGDQTILFLAGLTARKGVMDLLDAFEIVGERCPRARLLLAGEGDLREEIRARVRGSRFAERVTLPGLIARREVPALIAASTLFCLPSTREPFGMSAVEAMSVGRPLIVTDAGGLGELVDDRGGRRVPVGDPVALARAIVEILTTPGLAASMGSFNRELIERRIAWPVVIDSIESVYETVLAC